MKKIALFALAAAPIAACIPMMSSREIQEANARHYQRMCGDLNYAYETGNNDGLKRRPLDTGWVDMQCAPDYRQDVRQAYQSGYQTGMQNAPIVVEGRGFGRGGGYTSAQTCRFSSDCGGGDYSCRADSSGTNVCMGNGYAGDPCWFGSDCLSGSCSAKVCQ